MNDEGFMLNPAFDLPWLCSMSHELLVFACIIVFLLMSGTKKLKQFCIAFIIIYSFRLILKLFDENSFMLFITAVISGLLLNKHFFKHNINRTREIILSSINEGFLVIDQDNTITDMNPAAQKLDITKSYKIGHKIPFDSSLSRGIRSEENLIKGSFELTFTSGKKCFYTINYYIINSLKDIAVIIIDTTETKLQMHMLENQARLDFLTGVYNRRYFMELCGYEIERGKRATESVGIIMVDLDYFKAVNDNHGHITGDEVLKHAAKTFMACVRNIDIIARYGGDEFIIICPGADKQGIASIAERIREVLEKSELEYMGLSIKITGSFGAYSLEYQTNVRDYTVEDALSVADRALYEAKARGRNCVSVI